VIGGLCLFLNDQKIVALLSVRLDLSESVNEVDHDLVFLKDRSMVPSRYE